MLIRFGVAAASVPVQNNSSSTWCYIRCNMGCTKRKDVIPKSGQDFASES